MRPQDWITLTLSIIAVVFALLYILNRFISYTEYMNSRSKERRDELIKRQMNISKHSDIEITIKGCSMSGKTFLLGEINDMLKFMRYKTECFDDGMAVDGVKYEFPDNFEQQRNIIIRTEI